jgi:polysaccharide biosynthesis/export protein
MQKPGLIQSLKRPASQLALVSLFTIAASPLPGFAQSSPSTPSPSDPVPVSPFPPTSSPSTPDPAPQDSSNYLLGAGDKLKLDIYNVPEFSGEYQVLSDGTLNLPAIGALSVRGMTLKQASAEISTRFKKVLRRPVVTVSLLEARPVKIAIAGEVNNPGTYTVSPTSETGIPSVTRMIQQAGGFTQSADLRMVQVRRRQPGKVGTSNSINVNLLQLIRTGDISQDLLLQDGDSIFIPTAASIDIAEANEIAAASFAPSEARAIKVAVVGQVNRPGPYTLQPSTQAPGTTTPGAVGDSKSRILTVTQAIQAAGGITSYADIYNIQVRRLTKTGEPERTVAVNFRKLLEGDIRQDLPLQEGDTIIIPKAAAINPAEATELATASFSPDKITVNVVGEVTDPGAVEVPPNTPLNQALLAAGGFNRRASKGSVELIRLNPNGTVERRKIDINLAQGANEQGNPTLRNNDTLVVRRSGLATVGDTLGLFLSPVTGVFSLFRLLGL